MDTQVIIDALPEILTQLFAFLLVFVVLKKYAFASVFQIIDDRKAAIQKSLDDAEASKSGLENLKKDYEVRMQSIDQDGRKKIQEAIQEGQRVAGEIRVKAQEEARSFTDRAQRDIAQEMDKAKEVIRRQIVELSTDIASKVVEKDLKNAENEKFIETLLEQAGDLK